jgi:hypothetical protein
VRTARCQRLDIQLRHWAEVHSPVTVGQTK